MLRNPLCVSSSICQLCSSREKKKLKLRLASTFYHAITFISLNSSLLLRHITLAFQKHWLKGLESFSVLARDITVALVWVLSSHSWLTVAEITASVWSSQPECCLHASQEWASYLHPASSHTCWGLGILKHREGSIHCCKNYSCSVKNPKPQNNSSSFAEMLEELTTSCLYVRRVKRSQNHRT